MSDVTIVTPWTDRPWIAPAFARVRAHVEAGLRRAGRSWEWRIVTAWDVEDVGAMRRECVRRAQGRSVAFVDSDDWHDPERLPVALQAIDGGAGVVAQPWARCDGERAVARDWPCLQALVARTETARALLRTYPSVPSGDCLDGDGYYATALYARAVHLTAPAPAFVAVIHPASTTARIAVWRLPPRTDAPPEALAHARHVVGLSRHHAP